MIQEPRRLGAINWLGLWTLYVKEVRRFLKVHFQTVTAPLVTTLLFLAVFALSVGKAVAHVKGVPFLEFLAPGLIMMAMVQNAFANTSSSIIISKVQGNIVDVLMPPLSAAELTLGFTLGGITRGLMVGAVVGLTMSVLVTLSVHSWLFVIYHAVMAVMMLSLLGIAGGVWADKFDHMAAVTNFIITPLSFLSGTFYSLDRLPPFWRLVGQFNPFFYMIDGFRYGFTGHADGSIPIGVVVMAGVNLALWALVHWMFATGYKLKA